MQVELQTIKEQVTLVANRLLEVANLREGDVFVLGCSSSEICGGQIGKAPAPRSARQSSKRCCPS